MTSPSNSPRNLALINIKLQEIEKRLSILEEPKSISLKENEIYFNGQTYDAYSKICDIMNAAQQELIIIDPYADRKVLDMIANINCHVILICRKTNSPLKKIDIAKYNEQYHNLAIKRSDDFHDRYFFLDRQTLYHCGMSLNFAGKHTFSINHIEDSFVKSSFLNEISPYLPKTIAAHPLYVKSPVKHNINY